MTTPDLKRHIDRVPKFMHLDLSRVENLDDLMFQVEHEIDLAEEGDIRWTKRQMHQAKMFFANLNIAAQEAR